jgi:ATP-dependent protease ClpP protease subunit
MSLVDVVEMPRRLAALHDRARPVDPRPWYRIADLADDTAELSIFDEIGFWGITEGEFADHLAQVTAPRLTVKINSPGGSLFAGIAIGNMIRAHPAHVTSRVVGLAASIASVIMLAGDEIVIEQGAQVMCHDALGMLCGNAADAREFADFLDRQSDNLADAYAARAGGTREEWRARMVKESWFMADEAVAVGLADRVAEYPRKKSGDEGDPDVPVAAKSTVWDLSIFRYAGRAEAPDPLARHPEPPVAEPEPARTVALVDLAQVRAEVETAVAAANTAVPPWFEAWASAASTSVPAVGPDVAETPTDEPDPPATEVDEPPADSEPEPSADDEKGDWSAAVAPLTAPTDRWAAATAHLRGTAGDDRSATRPEDVR